MILYALAAIGAVCLACSALIALVAARDLWQQRQNVRAANVPSRYYPRPAVTLDRDESGSVVVPFRVR